MRQAEWLSWFYARIARRTNASRRVKAHHRREPLVAVESLEARCLLSAGDLDLSFGVGGIVTTSFAVASVQSTSLALQGDGKILVAGTTLDNTFAFTVARYNADGTLDSTFDGDGVATTRFGDARGFATSVVVQADGKIVVAGRIADSSSVDFGLVQYNGDGSLDSEFGIGGIVRTSFGTSQCRIESMALQSDGKIVVAGYLDTNIGSDNYAFALARYATDGSLDSLFDGDGKLTTDFGPGIDVAYSVALGPNGKIVAAGFTSNGSNEDIAVVRYNDDGTFDEAFNADGKLTADFGTASDRARRVVATTDGKIFVLGTTSSGVVLSRFTTTGTLDSSFDDDGKLPLAFGSNIALQSDGAVIVGDVINASFFALARFTANGSADDSFGVDGTATADFGTPGALLKSVALQDDGRIVAAGFVITNNSGDNDFALARFLNTISTPMNSPPTFMSSSEVSVSEKTSAIVTFSADDPENDLLTYSLAGGPDMALFAIDSANGELSFLALPDFEQPADADRDNVYLVTVQVSDGSNVATQDVEVTVTNVDESLTVTLPTAGGLETAFLMDGKLHVRRSRNTPDLIAPVVLAHVNAIRFQGSERDDRLTLDRSISAFSGLIIFTGGRGSDLLNARAIGVPVTFDGGDGNDTFLGGSGNDLIVGGAGNDNLSSGAGYDTLSGGTGNDLLIGEVGNDLVTGGPGADTVQGGTGDDTLRGESGIDSLVGGEGGDLLDGGEGNDILVGGNGDDVLNGGVGDDQIQGGNGNDSISGGAGNDSLNGNAGNDILLGSDGRDSLCGDAGTDTLLGGNGNDVLRGGADLDTINPGSGRNQVFDPSHVIDTSFAFDFDALLAGLSSDSFPR